MDDIDFQLGYDLAYERLQQTDLFIAQDVVAKPDEAQTKLLHDAKELPLGVKRGIAHCIHDTQRQDASRFRSQQKLFGNMSVRSTCEVCGLGLPTATDEHFDSHFRENTIELRLLSGQETVVCEKVGRPKNSLSKKREMALHKLLQLSELRLATRKRALLELHGSHAPQPLLSLRHGGSCLLQKPELSGAMRGWHVAENEWCSWLDNKIQNLESKKTETQSAPVDVIRFGSLVCCSNNRNYWQTCFAKRYVPLHWRPMLRGFDESLLPAIHPNHALLLNKGSSKNVVFTDDPFYARMCDVCGEGFRVEKAKTSHAPEEFILRDAIYKPHSRDDVVHQKCFAALQEQDVALKETKKRARTTLIQKI